MLVFLATMQILFLPSELSSMGHFTVIGALLTLDTGIPGLAARTRDHAGKATALGLVQKLILTGCGGLSEATHKW